MEKFLPPLEKILGAPLGVFRNSSRIGWGNKPEACACTQPDEGAFTRTPEEADNHPSLLATLRGFLFGGREALPPPPPLPQATLETDRFLVRLRPDAPPVRITPHAPTFAFPVSSIHNYQGERPPSTPSEIIGGAFYERSGKMAHWLDVLTC